MIIEATKEEVNALHQLIHRAVLHSGMDAAEAACFWKRKLIAAAEAEAKLQANGKAADMQPPAVPASALRA